MYSFVGGMTCATASRLSKNHPNGSPQGAFILIGDFPVGGKGLLVIMLLGIYHLSSFTTSLAPTSLLLFCYLLCNLILFFSTCLLRGMEVVGVLHVPGRGCYLLTLQELLCLSSLPFYLWMCVHSIWVLHHRNSSAQ